VRRAQERARKDVVQWIPEVVYGSMPLPGIADAQPHSCLAAWEGCSSEALQTRGYVGVEPSQYGFFGVEIVPANESLLVPGAGFEQNPIGSSSWPLITGLENHLATGPPPDLCDFPQLSSLSWSTSDRMQHSVKVPDTQQLASLSGSQLEDLAKAVAQAQALAKENELKASANSAKPGRHNTAVGKVNKRESGSQHKQSLFKCPHSECNATFRRNKDRTRHIRVKHQEIPGFACPIVDCTMGTGHTFPRSDKLRDHLRGKAVSTMTWRCILPGCSETGIHRAWWFDHIKQHGPKTREANAEILNNYGYKDFYGGYPFLEYLCTHPGCPFGTKSSTDLDEHLLIPHDGPHCSCPIPGCKTVCRNWDAVRQHLAADHSRSTREAVEDVLNSQGFYYCDSALACPVLSCRHVVQSFSWNTSLECQTRVHCQKHDFATLRSAAKSLVNAFRFTFEGYFLWTKPLKFKLNAETSSSNQIFACLTFTDAELSEAEKPEDLDRLCFEKGINLP
jgi:uncharacterized C2H2 Zn-finger protein